MRRPGKTREGDAMDMERLGLTSGKWVVANCGKFPTEKSCKLVIMAPQDQHEDLVEAAATHAIRSHRHEDTPELRKELGAMLETIDV
jgi:hypothetical protein